MKKSKKISNIVFLILTMFSFFAFLFCLIINQKFIAMQFLFLFFSLFLPAIISFITQIKITFLMQITYNIFLILHFILGEICSFYIKYYYYDTALHFLSAILLAILGYAIIHYYLKDSSLVIQLIFSIMFSLSLEYMWEILEFTIDHFCNTNMQRFIKNDIVLSGHMALFDTTKDMIVAFMGSMCIIFLINIKRIRKLEISKQ